jgi:hypothetical protein
MDGFGETVDVGLKDYEFLVFGLFVVEERELLRASAHG